MSVKTDPASAEIPSAEVFVPAAILDPDFPGLRAAPGQPLSCVQSVLSGQPDPSGSSVPCAQSVPCDQSVPGDISVASGQPVTPGLPAVSVRPVSPAQGAIAGRPAVSGYGAVCTDGAGPSGALPSVAGVPPSFGAFALAVYPFLELQPFHRAYYRVLEAFAAGRIRRLIVTMPPQHGKSVGATTLLPAYVLGLDPDLRVAIASYSGALASKFNRRVQRILCSAEYGELFPDTTIKRGSKPPEYIRTADEVEIVGREGSLLSVGREGSLTGNRVDCFLLDDLYKDAMEANSPLVRENCWEWYTSVVRTRMHNASRELIVFTRWHEEDLIGRLVAKEEVTGLKSWNQIERENGNGWLLLNFEAVKRSPPTEIDPRSEGEPLWGERHSTGLLAERMKLDPLRFECMYQGHPSAAQGLLYGDRFMLYEQLPETLVRYANYTDTADTGDDYLCSVCYAVDAQRRIYVTEVVYSREGMEVTEEVVAAMLQQVPGCDVLVESNNGGRGFARAVSRLCPNHRIGWFCQSANKEARILSNASAVLRNICMPVDWVARWPEFAHDLLSYRRIFRTNRWHDAPDVLTGIAEREICGTLSKKIRALSFKR